MKSDTSPAFRAAQTIRQQLQPIIDNLNRVVLGKPMQIRLALTCLLAQGHLLIEDLPGLGKTTLAHALAKVLGLHYQRIQFTSDLLPADILGVSIYQRQTESFEFHPGPIFSQLILADEVNRATPKTQSALLEAMEEKQVTIDGQTRSLPEPFFVIATQNPSTQIGTFPLPESQLDRFLMKLSLGYLDSKAERELLLGQDRKHLLADIKPAINAASLLQLQRHVHRVQLADAVLDYLQNILQYTRNNPTFDNGLSPRAGLAIKHAAQAWAMLHGRTYVLPEDVQAVLLPVAMHRLRHPEQGYFTESVLRKQLLEAVPVT